MYQNEPLIKTAFDKVTGKILNGEKLFQDREYGFQIRKKYNEELIQPFCCECGQDLTVAKSPKPYRKVFLKHKPDHSLCLLTDKTLSTEEQNEINNILISKESDRHIYLKNKIGTLLEAVKNIDNNSISIDNKFIEIDGEKRKPDVYCEFYHKEITKKIVFEIQLSKLSQRYILSRYNFYKKNGIYLIWVLDNFDIHNQGGLEEDIKYLAKHQNFFKLDETNDKTLKLQCDYKVCWLNESHEIYSFWKSQSLSLHQLTFDNEDYQVLFYNYEVKKCELEKQRLKKIKELENNRKEQTRKKKELEVENIVVTIKTYKNDGADKYQYINLEKKIAELDSEQIHSLNSQLEFKEFPKALHQWIKDSTSKNISFILFIIGCDKISTNIMINSKNSSGKSIFQITIENGNLYYHQQENMIALLFENHYRLTEEDINSFKKHPSFEGDFRKKLVNFQLCDRLLDKCYVNKIISRNDNLLSIIESARLNEIVGLNFQPNQWIPVINVATSKSYLPYWQYIESAFKIYGLWDKISQRDTKGTFPKLIDKAYRNMPEPKDDMDEVMYDLFYEVWENVHGI